MTLHTSQTIIRKSLHHELVDRLQTLIINSELKPGARVPEKELCDQFGVYSSPILVLLCDHLTNQVSVHLSEA